MAIDEKAKNGFITITIIVFVIAFFLSFINAYSAFCCKDLVTDQKKCYNTGECCGDYWYTSCSCSERCTILGYNQATCNEEVTAPTCASNLCRYATSDGTHYSGDRKSVV